MENFEFGTAVDLDRQCVVCGHALGSEVFARVNVDGDMIPICCPLCFETFQKHPAVYAARHAGMKASREKPRPPTP